MTKPNPNEICSTCKYNVLNFCRRYPATIIFTDPVNEIPQPTAVYVPIKDPLSWWCGEWVTNK